MQTSARAGVSLATWRPAAFNRRAAAVARQRDGAGMLAQLLGSAVQSTAAGSFRCRPRTCSADMQRRHGRRPVSRRPGHRAPVDRRATARRPARSAVTCRTNNHQCVKYDKVLANHLIRYDRATIEDPNLVLFTGSPAGSRQHALLRRKTHLRGIL